MAGTPGRTQSSFRLHTFAAVASFLAICAILQGCSVQCTDGNYNECLEEHCGAGAHHACGDEDLDCCVSSATVGVARCSEGYTLVSFTYEERTICYEEGNGQETHHTVCCEPETSCPSDCSDQFWGLREGACDREQCLNCGPCYSGTSTPAPVPSSLPPERRNHQEHCGSWAATPSGAVCGYNTPDCCQDPRYVWCDASYTLYDVGEEPCDSRGRIWTCCQPRSRCPFECEIQASWSRGCEQEQCWGCAACEGLGSGGDMCCTAETSSCEACRLGMSEEDFCKLHPEFDGCTEEFIVDFFFLVMVAVMFLSAAFCCTGCCVGCSLSCCSGPLEQYGGPAQCCIMFVTVVSGVFLWLTTVFASSRVPSEAEPLQSLVVFAGYCVGACVGFPAAVWRERVADVLVGDALKVRSARVHPGAQPAPHVANPPYAAAPTMGIPVASNAVQAVVVGYQGEVDASSPATRGTPLVRGNTVVVQAAVVG